MTSIDGPVRWGILGTAGIAASAFLPALRESGAGVAVAVASRDLSRAQAWADENVVTRGVHGYETVLSDPEIEAVYIPLPNDLHAEWTIAALEAGKAVFCEKPLCATPEQTERVLACARTSAMLLWEGFVFPFQGQMERVRRLLAGGAVGEVREIRSSFNFVLDDSEDIRMLADRSGGSVQDVGCYPIRLARLLFDAEPDLGRTLADAVWATSGVDEELWGALRFPNDRRLLFSCGFRAGEDTAALVLGTRGEIRMTNPFHPEPGDQLVVVDGSGSRAEPAVPGGERSFTPAIRHIQRVVRGLETPRHLAVDEAAGNAAAIAAVLNAARVHR